MTKNTAKNTAPNTASADEGWEETEDEFGEVWEPEKEGDSIGGVYLGSAEVPNDTGTFMSHKIREAPGVIHAVAGARLDQLMERVPLEGQCKIVYCGMKKLDTNRNMRDYKVFQPKGQAVRPNRRAAEAAAS